MLSPIKTVFIHYPFRAFTTVALMILVSVLVYRNLNTKYKRNEISKQKAVLVWLLTNYSILLLFFTVLGRRSLDYYRYNFEFCYSYKEVFLLKDYALASQIIVNILMFIPVGLICGIIKKQHTILKSLLYGILMSVTIEVLQLVLRCGYFEFDDLLSNIIGTLIGCVMIKIHHCLRKNKRVYFGG